MLIIVCILLSISSVFGAKYNATCSNNTEKTLTFEKSSDGTDGRYKVEWCSTSYSRNSSWQLSVYYDDNRPKSQCHVLNSSIPRKDGTIHSQRSYSIPGDLNCSNVCLSTYRDLIFNGTCFHIKSGFLKGLGQSSKLDSAFFFTENEISRQHFIESKTYAIQLSLRKGLDSVTWYTGNTPVTDYSVHLCINERPECKDVTENCTTPHPYEIRCEIQAPRSSALHLKYDAPWTSAAIYKNLIANHIMLNETDTTEHVATPIDGPVQTSNLLVLAGSAVAVLLLLLVSAVVLRRRTKRRNIRDSDVPNSQGTANPQMLVATKSRVLLIYARDCPSFARAVELLIKALRLTGCEVIDIFSGDAVAVSATAPGEWVRRLVADPATRLLLLQSPAAAALYAATLRPSGTLSAPLLGRVAVRRTPHTSDGIAMIALRMLGEAAHRPRAYHKCYIASIEGLDCEMVPGVTPLRRYNLPKYAHLLLKDLAPQNPTTPNGSVYSEGPTDPTESSDFSDILHDLNITLREMCEYVKNNPNYLTDDLLFI